MREADEEKQGSEEAAEADRAEQPGQIAPGERCFPLASCSTPPDPQCSETQAGAEVQEAGEDLRRNARQQSLGEWCAAAEEQGGEERRADAST